MTGPGAFYADSFHFKREKKLEECVCMCVFINMRSFLWKARSSDDISVVILYEVCDGTMSKCWIFFMLFLRCVIDVHVFKKMEFLPTILFLSYARLLCLCAHCSYSIYIRNAILPERFYSFWTIHTAYHRTYYIWIEN